MFTEVQNSPCLSPRSLLGTHLFVFYIRLLRIIFTYLGQTFLKCGSTATYYGEGEVEIQASHVHERQEIWVQKYVRNVLRRGHKIVACKDADVRQTQRQYNGSETSTLQRENQGLSRNLVIMKLGNEDTGNKLVLPGDEVRSGQVTSGHVRSGQVTSGQVILRRAVSRPVYLGVRHPSRTGDQILSFFLSLFFDSYAFSVVSCPLWR
jgi:hypothetical protein